VLKNILYTDFSNLALPIVAAIARNKVVLESECPVLTYHFGDGW